MSREKCYQCMRPQTFCLCQHTKKFITKTKFVILMHPMEFKKEKNGTGRLTHLQLPNSEIIMGIDFSKDNQVNRYIQSTDYSCYILYPGEKSINLSQDKDVYEKLSQDKKRVIFLIDGTWPCAKKMLRKSTNLHDLPAISFDPNQKSKFKIKQQPLPECLSTIESTKIVIDLLTKHRVENCQTEGFLKPFEKMIDHLVHCMENPPPGSYRVKKGSTLKEKNHYKDPNKRNLFYSF